MGKEVMSFAELQGKVKVGWIVEEAPGNNSDHSFGGRQDTVTKVDGNRFWINNCSHSYSSPSYLKVVKGLFPNWDYLSVGDILIDDDGNERVVLGVIGQIVFFSDDTDTDDDIYDDNMENIQYLKKQGWKVKGEESTAKEVTMDEIAKAMNIDVKDLKIKKEN